MFRLSKHLVENWDRRVGAVPTNAEVNRLIRESKQIQEGCEVQTPGVLFKTISIYWHHKRGLIITVDHYTNKVVSVYTKDMDGPFGIGKRLGVHHHG